MNTQHMLERIALRVQDPTERDNLVSFIGRVVSSLGSESCAVRVIRLPESRGSLTYTEDGTGDSNGNCGVVVVRDGRVVTFMWRRDHQPHTAEQYRVERVRCLVGTCSHRTHTKTVAR